MSIVDVPGVGQVQFPEGMSQRDIIRAIEFDILPNVRPAAPAQTAAPQQQPTSILRDVPGALVSGIGGLGTAAGGIYGLATGDFDNAAARAGKYVQDVGRDIMSPGLRQRQEQFEQRLQSVQNQGLGTQAVEAVSGLASDPYLFGSMAVEQIPQLAASLGVGRVGSAVGQVAARRAGMEAAEQAARRGATGAAIGTSTGLQTGEVANSTYQDVMTLTSEVIDRSPAYQELRRTMTDREARVVLATQAAREASAIAAPLSAASAVLLPGVERMAFAQRAQQAALSRILGGAIFEGGQEAIEEGGGRFAQNVGARGADTARELSQGVGSAATTGAVLGAGAGGGFAALHGGPPPTGINQDNLPSELRQAINDYVGNREPLTGGENLLPREIPNIETPVGNLSRSQLERYMERRLPDMIRDDPELASRMSYLRNPDDRIDAFLDVLQQQQAGNVASRQGSEEGNIRREMANSPETQEAFRKAYIQQNAGRKPVSEPELQRDLAAAEQQVQQLVIARQDAESRLKAIEDAPTLDAVAREAAQAEITQLDQLIPARESIRRQIANSIPTYERENTARQNMLESAGSAFDIAQARRERMAEQKKAAGIEVPSGSGAPDTLPAQQDDTRAGAPQITDQQYLLNPEYEGGKLVGGEKVVEILPSDTFGKVLAYVRRQVGDFTQTVPVETTMDELVKMPVRESARMTQEVASALVGPEDVAGQKAGRAIDAEGQTLEPRRMVDRQGPEASAREAQGEQAQPEAQPTESDARAERRVAAQNRINALYLDKLKNKGRQGKLLRNALVNALKDRTLTAEQVYAAFVAAEVMSQILPATADHQVLFVRELLTSAETIKNSGGVEGQNVQGLRTRPNQPGMLGLIQLSLTENQLPFLRETAAHEAFHVLQDYYGKYDPQFAKLMRQGFRDDMKMTDLDPTIRRKLEQARFPGLNKSYWDVLTNSVKNEMTAREAQAYAFGALMDASRRGTPMAGLKPAFARFVNAMRQFFDRMGNKLRGDGFQTVEDVFGRVAKGDARRFSDRATPTEQDFAPTPKTAPLAQQKPAQPAPAAATAQPQASTTPPPAASETAPTQAAPTEAEATRKAVWSGPEYDMPVDVYSDAPQAGPDGVLYSRVSYNGKDSFVPTDGLKFEGKQTNQEPSTAGTEASARKTFDETRKDGDAYFRMSGLDVQETQSPRSRATLTYMSPDDFLMMAREGRNEIKAQGVSDLVKRGEKFSSLPALGFSHDGKGNAKVKSHEGRHRALALKEAGVKSMPVILISREDGVGDAIRWGVQSNERERVKNIPEVLQGEDNRGSIPMPDSVIYPIQSSDTEGRSEASARKNINDIKFGRVFAAAKQAEKNLSLEAKDFISQWQMSGWPTGPLQRAFNGLGDKNIADEILSVFVSVRNTLRREFGDTVRLYRGQRPFAPDELDPNRTLFSWSSDPKEARLFVGRPVKVLTDEEIDKAVKQYERSGFVKVGRHSYIRNKENPKYYDIFARKEYITDGDNLFRSLKDDQKDQISYNEEISKRGSVVSEEVPVERIIWVPGNLISKEFIVEQAPSVLAEQITEASARSPLLEGKQADQELSPSQAEASARATNLSVPEFTSWWNGGWKEGSKKKASVARERDGSPKRYYHGTPRDFKVFGGARSGALDDREGPFFFSPQPSFTDEYVDATNSKSKTNIPTEGQRVLSVYLSVQNPFDASNAQRQRELTNFLRDILSAGRLKPSDIMPPFKAKIYEQTIKDGTATQQEVAKEAFDVWRGTLADPDINWEAIEAPMVQKYIRGNGFDSFYIIENGVKNLAVYDPRQIKSIFNDFKEGAASSPEFSARSPLSEDQAYQSIAEKITGKELDKPNVFSDGLRRFVGALPGEKLSSALIRTTVNRAAPLWMLDRLAKERGLSLKSAGLAMEVALNNSGRVQMYLEHGPLAYNPRTGDVSIREDVPALIDAIKGKLNVQDKKEAQSYLVALREQDLRRNGKKGFFNLTDAEVATIISRAEAAHPEWKQMAADIQRINKALLDFAVNTGTLDRSKADQLASMFYTPFYRKAEEDAKDENNAGSVVGPRLSESLTNVKTAFDIKLQGGVNPLGDLFENMIRNADVIMKAGMKNVAMQQAAETMEAVGLGRGAKKREAGKTITYRENGQDKHFEVDDSVLYATLAGAPREFSNGIYKTMSQVAGFFRDMITAAPSFMIANLWRGKTMAYVQEGLPFYTNTFGGLKQALQASTSYKAIAAQTGFGGYTYGMGDRDIAKALERQIQGLGYGPGGMMRRAMGGLQKLSEATEMAERIKLYERMKAKGMTDKEAAYQAYLLAPFSRRGMGGGWIGSTVNWLVPLVPFLNAKIQGMYRLVENEKGDARVLKTIPKQMFLRGLVVMGASLALAAKNMADEPDRWNNETPDLKRGYDILYLPGGKRILFPRSFEVGNAFGTIPVFLLDAAMKKDGRDLAGMLASVGTSTFFFNPIPQAIVPILSVATNYDFFRNKPLENASDLGKLPGERVNRSTSSVARVIGENAGLSPIRIQALMEGYSGSIGTAVLAGFDSILAGMGLIPGKPAGPFGDPLSMPAIVAGLTGANRFYRTDDQVASRFVGDFYRIKEMTDQLVRSRNDAVKANDRDRLQELRGEAGLPLQMRNVVNTANTQIANINQNIRRIERGALSSVEKAAAIQPLITQRDRIAKRVVDRAVSLGVL